MGQTSSTLPHIEGRKFICLPSQHRHSLRLQVFQGQIQIEDGFCTGTNDQDRCATQFRQVSRDIHVCLCSTMYTADTTCGKKANTCYTGTQHGTGYRGRSQAMCS